MIALFATWEAALRYCIEHSIPFELDRTVVDADEYEIAVIML